MSFLSSSMLALQASRDCSNCVRWSFLCSITVIISCSIFALASSAAALADVSLSLEDNAEGCSCSDDDMISEVFVVKFSRTSAHSSASDDNRFAAFTEGPLSLPLRCRSTVEVERMSKSFTLPSMILIAFSKLLRCPSISTEISVTVLRCSSFTSSSASLLLINNSLNSSKSQHSNHSYPPRYTSLHSTSSSSSSPPLPITTFLVVTKI
mmetsp:Transcript_28783/g.43236  ORF Transcript_28783/g.43236 Transcript_28783/m.43236 type:complete len:209 (+) Transcript_28783:261-887(+)